jgi:transcriptional regulator with XRE-family HTH domain
MPNVKNQLAERLKALRKDVPLNQVESAIGIRRRLLKFYEDGEKVPGDQNLKKLSTFYNVPFADLKELWLADLFPEGSENRDIVLQWAQKLLKAE